MKKLKEAALTRPEDFYQMSSFGSPVILFGFLIGALHNLCEDFGIERPAAEDFHPECKGDDELMDWWDIMYWLKQGLLDSCIESDKHGRHGDMFAEAAAQLYGIHTHSMETVADYEFQWLLCRPYSNQILTLKDAWQSIKDGHDKLAVSNEYSGENLLHVLIVQNMSEKYQLPWHLAVLFGKFVTRPQFRWNLMNEKVGCVNLDFRYSALILLHVCFVTLLSFRYIGNRPLLLPRAWRSYRLGPNPVALCRLSRLG
jgi:hypothetical protein